MNIYAKHIYFFFLELPLWLSHSLNISLRLPRNNWEGSECLETRSSWNDHVIYLALLKGCPTKYAHDELYVDVVNARRKLQVCDRATSAYGSRSYLAFRSSLLKLLLPGLFLGDASPDRCQGFPRERTEQTSFFLWYRVRIFGHCLGCAQLSHLPANANQWHEIRLEKRIR